MGKLAPTDTLNTVQKKEREICIFYLVPGLWLMREKEQIYTHTVKSTHYSEIYTLTGGSRGLQGETPVEGTSGSYVLQQLVSNYSPRFAISRDCLVRCHFREDRTQDSEQP